MLLTIRNSIMLFAGILLAFSTVGLASKEFLLHDKLFGKYNKNVRPVHHQNTTVEVIIHMYLGFTVDHVDLLKEIVVGNVWLDISWKDQFLSWNTSDYDGVRYITMDSKDIWLPDLMLFSIWGKVYMLNHESMGRALIWSNGIVRTTPMQDMEVEFDANVYKYPFDVHDCFVQIGSRSYTNNLVSIKWSAASVATINQTGYVNGQWVIMKQDIENLTFAVNGVYTVDQVRYNFTLKRKWQYYVLNIMAPVATTSTLNILCFALPSDSGERITLCISIYLTLAVFLNVVNSALPETSDEQSILAIYIGLQFLATTFTIIMTVVTLKLYHHQGNSMSSSSTSLNRIIDKLYKRKPKYEAEITEIENHVTEKEATAITQYGPYRRLSYTMNAVCFYLSVAWNIGLIIAFIVVVRS